MTRRGKIARLPSNIREELNQRLENGEQGGRVIEWLNGLPEVKAVLAQDFEGQPISDANLSQWKSGGFRDWQALREAQAMMERWRVEDGSQGSDGGGQKTEVGGVAVEAMVGAVTNALMAHYAGAVQDSNADAEEEPNARVERLGRSLRDMSRLRRDELARERLREHVRIDEEWVAIERERLELERARLNKQAAPGADVNGEPPLSHDEKAEMVKQMLRDL